MSTFLFLRTILESSEDGPTPTAMASPGGIRNESILDLVPRKPALNDLPLPTLGKNKRQQKKKQTNKKNLEYI